MATSTLSANAANTALTLHILHKLEGNMLPATLQRCFAKHDALLLTGDGVYAALNTKNTLPARCYALEADVRARGLLSLWPATIALIDHGDFVDLCVKYQKSVSWG
jgi:tRNA 2-thiouridine synthesizing protein B